jgi:uncharacterized protein (DUF3084 family)
MALPMHSQTISKNKPRVQTLITPQGDTLVQFHIKDAKKLLADVLDKKIVDSLVNVYMQRDAINKNTIDLQVSQIKLLQQKSVNQEQQIANLDKIIANKDEEVAILNNVVEEQKKEIKKQKRLKTLGFVGSVVLPILVLLL